MFNVDEVIPTSTGDRGQNILEQPLDSVNDNLRVNHSQQSIEFK
jgi:hypothetical protein